MRVLKMITLLTFLAAALHAANIPKIMIAYEGYTDEAVKTLPIYPEIERIAILEIENDTTGFLNEVLTASIIKSGKYKVIERRDFERIMNEHRFNCSNEAILDRESIARLGKILSVDAVMYGTLYYRIIDNERIPLLSLKLTGVEKADILWSEPVLFLKKEVSSAAPSLAIIILVIMLFLPGLVKYIYLWRGSGMLKIFIDRRDPYFSKRELNIEIFDKNKKNYLSKRMKYGKNLSLYVEPGFYKVCLLGGVFRAEKSIHVRKGAVMDVVMKCC